MEYVSSVWDPHLKKDSEDIECVQKFALKFGNLLNLADIPTLASRRQQL